MQQEHWEGDWTSLAFYTPQSSSVPRNMEAKVVVTWGTLLVRSGSWARGFLYFHLQIRRKPELGACPSATSLQAGWPFFHIWLRHWVYGPHGRKSTIAVLTETRKEAVFQSHGLHRPDKWLGEGPFMGLWLSTTLGLPLYEDVMSINSRTPELKRIIENMPFNVFILL